ncbi:MAG: hypothetical protein KJ714_05605 [Euryarchaeota archaeon]|nr:hypothetical protein [Euryarchaeota archaeon]
MIGVEVKKINNIDVDVSDRAARLLGIAFDSLVPARYDYISLTYTGSNLTGVVYKTGGAGGTVVSTLTLAYDVNNNLQSVTKT